MLAALGEAELQKTVTLIKELQKTVRRRPHPIITHSHPRPTMYVLVATYLPSAALRGSGLVARALLRADLFEFGSKSVRSP